MAQLLKQHRFRKLRNSEEISPSLISDTRNQTNFVERTTETRSLELRQSYNVIVVFTLINLEKGKWKGLVLAFELGTLDKLINTKVATSWFWVAKRNPTARLKHKAGAPLLGLIKESYHHHLGEECPPRSRVWGSQQCEVWVGRSSLLACETLSLFYKPRKLRPRFSTGGQCNFCT